MLLFKANGGKLGRGTWAHYWIEEVGVEKGERA